MDPPVEEHPVAGENQIPSWLASHLKTDDLSRIESAVKAAELQTAAEIVPLVVRRSASIAHLPLMLAFLLCLISLIGIWPYHAWIEAHHAALFLPLLMVILSALAIPLSQIVWIQRFLLTSVDAELQVRRRAWAEFAALKVGSTEDHRGLLIMISVMERKVVVLPDQGLSQALSADAANEWVQSLAKHLKTGEWGAAFTETLSDMGKRLGEIAPREASSRDELSNRLQIRD